MADLLAGIPAEVVIADECFWGEAHHDRIGADGISSMSLVHPVNQ